MNCIQRRFMCVNCLEVAPARRNSAPVSLDSRVERILKEDTVLISPQKMDIMTSGSTWNDISLMLLWWPRHVRVSVRGFISIVSSILKQFAQLDPQGSHWPVFVHRLPSSSLNATTGLSSNSRATAPCLICPSGRPSCLPCTLAFVISVALGWKMITWCHWRNLPNLFPPIRNWLLTCVISFVRQIVSMEKSSPLLKYGPCGCVEVWRVELQIWF